MSWLFPLYALGALALAAPVLFHMFQRRPHGQQEFSSLMFLEATPPRLTRRSRLSDWLLLLLRASVLLLLAAAFARPFLRSSSLLDLDASARSVALLVDTSASMRRDGIWDRTQESVSKVVSELRPTDQVMLIGFDRDPETLISFEAWEETDASQRIPLVTAQTAGLQPSWYATDFSAAMIEASDALLQQRLVEDSKQPLQVVVFTDLQEGSDLAGLQTYEWPEDVTIDIRTVVPEKKTNASIQSLPPEPGETDASQIRVIVRNEAESDRGQFQLTWNTPDARPVDVYVPPGQTRVAKITQPSGAIHLSLTGDDNTFDNELYLSETTPIKQKLYYFGDESDSDQAGLFFYLKQSSLDTRLREVTIERPQPQSLATATPEQCPLIVVSKPLVGNALTDLNRYVSRGGRLLIVLTERLGDSAAVEFLGNVLRLANVEVINSDDRDYSLLSQIDFQHALFQPFADPRFSDFSRIQFWSHRRIASTDDDPWTILAGLDDDTPALVEKKLDAGTAWVLTSGWQPIESRLALSSKFIPLLHGFYGGVTESTTPTVSYRVGQPIEIPEIAEPSTVLGPQGQVYSLDEKATSFDDVEEPGIYTLKQNGRETALAVNLTRNESHTTAMMPDQLEQLGLKLGEQKSLDAMKKEKRLMRNKELESNQKLWRWGVLAALVAVAMETWMAGRLARPAFN